MVLLLWWDNVVAQVRCQGLLGGGRHKGGARGGWSCPRWETEQARTFSTYSTCPLSVSSFLIAGEIPWW